ncbi:hypothetical protein WMF30_10295 [Sorangium sp. So ce134]
MSSENHADDREQAVTEGHRLALTGVMMHCARELGREDPMARLAVLEQERAHAVATLRRVCRDHGDNDWSDSLNLSDIIEKHLERHLPEDGGSELSTRTAALRSLRELWQESVRLCGSVPFDRSRADAGDGIRTAVLRVARSIGIDGQDLEGQRQG